MSTDQTMKHPPRRERVLVVETNEALRSLMARYLEELGHEPTIASSLLVAREIVATGLPRIVMLNAAAAQDLGIADTVRWLRGKCHVGVIVTSGGWAPDREFLALEHVRFLSKPFLIDDLRAVTDALCDELRRASAGGAS